MAYKSRWKRRWLSIAIVFAIAIVIYQFFLLPFLLQWGSTEKEFDGYLPGDELMKAKGYKNTLAVTVNASPSQVWPWIAQMGLHKGGFYTYTRLENLFGCGLKNSDTINPAWQNPKVGDLEAVCKSQEGKPGSGWQIAVVQINKALVWKGMNNAPWMMGIYLDSINQHSSRLITRQQFKYPKKWSTSWWLEKLCFEWAHCVMQKGMINGVKKRVHNNRNP